VSWCGWHVLGRGVPLTRIAVVTQNKRQTCCCLLQVRRRGQAAAQARHPADVAAQQVWPTDCRRWKGGDTAF